MSKQEQPKPRVLVALSGGVDSSVAAGLLKEQGYDVFGVTLHLWDAAPGEAVGRCCAPEDRADARRTCEHLGIPHYVFDERKAFREHVIEPFVDAYRRGETPSPCSHCNRTVKLVHLLELAGDLGADFVATGHYAQVDEAGVLMRARDDEKDQSYFLFGVPTSVLKRCLFPLGAMTKTEVREHARRLELPNADKGDSQELCFVPDGKIADFVKKERGDSPKGRLVDMESGKTLKSHDGVEAFTVGQRKGLGLGGGPTRYVLKIVNNDVLVGEREALFRNTLTVDQMHWTSDGSVPTTDGTNRDTFRAAVRIRHRHTPAQAEVRRDGDRAYVVFDEAQRAITPGQAAVIYDGDRVVGGGYIAAE